MSDSERTSFEIQQGKDDYRNKDLDGAVSHYLTAAELAPRDMSPLYHIANIKFEQEKYAECVKIYTNAIKVGKDYKANEEKMVAKAIVMRGKAYKQLGEETKFKEDLEKAIEFLSFIARVKFENRKWLECIDFSDRVIMMGQENGLTISADVLEYKSKSFIKMGQEACNNGNRNLTLQCFKDAWKYEEAGKFSCLPLKCAEMFYNQGEFTRCVIYLGSFIPIGERFPEEYNQEDMCRMRALQGKSLRRANGFDVTFDTRPWLQFVKEDNASAITMEIMVMWLGDVLGKQLAQNYFRMADFDGDGWANLEDILYLRESLNVDKKKRSSIDFATLIPRNPEEGPMDVLSAWMRAETLDD